MNHPRPGRLVVTSPAELAASSAAIEDACQTSPGSRSSSRSRPRRRSRRTGTSFEPRSVSVGRRTVAGGLRTPSELSELEPDHRIDVLSIATHETGSGSQGASDRQRRLLWLQAAGYTYRGDLRRHREYDQDRRAPDFRAEGKCWPHRTFAPTDPVPLSGRIPARRIVDFLAALRSDHSCALRGHRALCGHCYVLSNRL